MDRMTVSMFWPRRARGATSARMAVFALGGVLLLAGLVILAMGWLPAPGTDQARTAAQHGVEQVADRLASVREVLRRPEILSAAGRAGEVGSNAPLRRALGEAGLGDVVDVGVYPVHVEEIEPGSYPRPDYSVIQMLIEARNNGSARTQAHYPGTANENLAFAQAIPGAGGEPEAILFVRLPMTILADELATPGEKGWLSVIQDEREVMRNGDGTSRAAQENSRIDIEGSRLSIEWGVTGLPGPWSPKLGMAVLAAGTGLMLLGLLVGRPIRSPRRARPAPARGTVSASPAAQPEADRERSRDTGQAPGAPQPASASKAEQEAPPGEAEPRPDLPDWLLDKDAEAADPFGQAPADEGEEKSEWSGDEAGDAGDEAASETGGLELEVPDLDEILEEIEGSSEQIEASDPGDQIERRSESLPELSLESLSPDEDDAEAPERELSIDMGEEEAPMDEADPSQAPTESAELPVDSIVPLPAPFHADGIRGKFEEELDAETATRIGRAIAALAVERGLSRICAGRDGRLSGPVMLSALIRGLRDGGLDVIELGAAPTPLIWYAAIEMADGCGVSVTASHLPSEHNGFRIMLNGELVAGEAMRELARLYQEGGEADEEGGYEQLDVLDRYRERLSSDVQLERPLKVVVDCGNGIVGSVATVLFEAIGADIVPLYCDVDGSFPNHLPDPSVSENVEDLRLCVRNFQADVGIAFDGDGDRVRLVTAEGTVVGTDRLLMLLAKSVVSTGSGATVVCDVRGSAHLHHVVEQAGGRAIASPAGPARVAQTMRDEEAVLGAEMSGHVFIADRWYGFDDAIYAAARSLELVASASIDAEQLLYERLPIFLATREMDLDLPAERARDLLKRFASQVDFGAAVITRVDGVRVDHRDRWGLLRVDQETGRLLISFGANDARAITRIKARFREVLLDIEPDLQLPY